MKAQLTFDLADEMDEHRYNQCVKAEDMALALWDIAHNLRKRSEWDTDTRTGNADIVDVIFENIEWILEGNNIDIDKITK